MRDLTSEDLVVILEGMGGMEHASVVVAGVLLYRGDPELWEHIIKGMKDDGLRMDHHQTNASKLNTKLRSMCEDEDAG